MRLAALELIRTLTHSAMLEEAFADQVMAAAAEADDAGDPEQTELFRATARAHRVRVLELQGQLAALYEQYAQTYHPDR